MIGWFEMWNKPYPTRDMGHGWVGAFTIPRELQYKEGDIFQTPVRELKDYLFDAAKGEVPACSVIEFSFFGEGSVTIEGDNGKVIIGNDGGVYLDTRSANNSFGSIRRTNLNYGSCEVKILLDISGIEVFVDGGREVISSRIYIDGNYRIQTFGGVSRLKVKGVGGKQ